MSQRDYSWLRDETLCEGEFNSKQAGVPSFHPVSLTERVWDLSREKVLPLLRLKYREAISNAVAELSKPEEIGILFAGFQNFLQR